MKSLKSIKLLILLPLPLMLAAENNHNKLHKIEVKCHVELAGGKDKILFAKIKRSEMNTKTFLKGYKVDINRLIECVELHKPFSSNKSQRIDAATAR